MQVETIRALDASALDRVVGAAAVDERIFSQGCMRRGEDPSAIVQAEVYYWDANDP